MAVDLPAVYVKDGKPARHVTNESERTAAVFEGFKPHKADAGDSKPSEDELAAREAEKAKAAEAEKARRNAGNTNQRTN